MSQPHTRSRRRWLALLAILLIVGMAGTIMILLDDRGNGDVPAPSVASGTESDVLLHDGVRYRLRKGVETVLVMGLDKMEGYVDGDPGNVNHEQADFLLLLLIDRHEHTCVPLHINRDTMCRVDTLDALGKPMSYVDAQIATAHAYGSGGRDSCLNQTRAVSRLLYDRPIDHYVEITMDAVPVINDMVGGVTLTVQDDFSKVDPTLVQGQTVTLMGEQALTYVRARFDVGDTTNLSRMARQRQYMAALRRLLVDKLHAEEDFALRVLNRLSGYMESDCDIYELADIVTAVTDYDMAEFQTVAGEAVEGERFMEFYADEFALQQQVIDLFYRPEEESSAPASH